MQTLTPLECDGALSDLILQAARQALPKHIDSLITLPDVGERNQPLMPLLMGLIDAAKVTARAVADNAWDSGQAVPKDLAAMVAADLRECVRFVWESTEAF
jgi:hypothetical protein